MEQQTLEVKIVFLTEHNPGTPEHLHEVARRYFEAKGVTLSANNTIEV